MTLSLQTALDNLRTALRALDDSGSDGFEGLLAVVFGKITGHAFRLATAGRQLGVDGQTLDEGPFIAFEAKLYKDRVPSTEVYNKITSIAAKDRQPDVWVLGATAEVGTQTLETLSAASRRFGMSVRLLDWPPAAALPPLAVVCAMAGAEVATFLARHMKKGPSNQEVEAALATIAAAPTFEADAAEIRSGLSEPTLGPPIALERNTQWLRAAFKDRRRAKAEFGQALAPDDPDDSMLRARPRQGLAKQLSDAVEAPSTGGVIAVVGREGAGKSWLVAESWRSQARPALTLIVPATDISGDGSASAFDDLLVKALIRQTGEVEGPDVIGRWRRRLAAWAKTPPDRPRFVIHVDGLNQNFHFRWPRWLDGAAARTQELGGVLVVTARQAYFRDDIKDTLTGPVRLIEIPEWTPGELRTILAEEGVDGSGLGEEVLKGLRNPRLLGIAFDLLRRRAIRDFRELTPGRLLFEHIRIAGDPAVSQSAIAFRDRLARHARDVLGRIEAQADQDRLVFDGAAAAEPHLLSDMLVRVADGNYFRALADDPIRYELTDDGLAVALGLSILQALARVHRNQGDVREALRELLEPIEALDRTAEVILEALVYACLDDNPAPVVRSALIDAFVRLQNPPPTAFDPFVAAVRQRPGEALNALYMVATTGGYVAHRNWLVAALRGCWDDDAGRACLTERINDWLRLYTVSSKVGDHFGQSTEERDRERVRLREKINDRLALMSPAERGLLAEMRPAEFNPGQLTLDALTLLAGQPLAGFAAGLASWAFADALNSRAYNATDRFQALIRYNRRDWRACRDALLAAAARLDGPEASSTGQWSRVTILRATATPNDTAEAEALAERLIAGRDRPGAWRLVEDYCATDPCDPDAPLPSNIQTTARRYRRVNTAAMSKEREGGHDRHFFEEALPGVARFRPRSAVAVQRRYIDDVLRQTGRDLMLGVTDLGVRSALLTPANRAALLTLAGALSAPRDPKARATSDAWVTSQYALFLVYPYLTGDQQLEILMALPPHGPVLLQVIDVLKIGRAETVHRALAAAIASEEETRVYAALAFAGLSGAKVSRKTRALISDLLADPRTVVRGLAMAVVRQLDDRALIQRFADSRWSAWEADGDGRMIEAWHGSRLLVRALELDLIDGERVLDRITFGQYSRAAGSPRLAPLDIAERLGGAVDRAMAHEPAFEPPPVEQALEPDRSVGPAFLSLSNPVRRRIFETLLQDMNETDEQFHDRQTQAWDSFQRFDNLLTADRARLIIDDVGFPAVAACVDHVPGWGERIARRIIAAPMAARSHVRNFSLRLSRALSGAEAQLGAELYAAVEGAHAFVTLQEGLAKIPLEVMSAWRAVDNEVWDRLRRDRLDKAASDAALAQEVMAALMAGRESAILQYARDCLGQEQPVRVARGLIVLGFSLDTPEADGLIRSFESTEGFIGAAAKAARFAFQRNRWSRHWFEIMAATSSPEEYWRISVLLAKIVDARFDVWEADIVRTGRPAQRFERMLWKDIERRVGRWADKRKDTLLAAKPPARVFLGGDDDEDET